MYTFKKEHCYYCDFHCHSNHSDGEYSRREVIQRAISENKDATLILAITDHNCAFDDLLELQKEFGDKILLISGSEVSATYHVPNSERKLEIHINALDYEQNHPVFLSMLQKNQHDKRSYIEMILSKLEAIGFHVVDSYEELKEFVLPSPHVGRMALARMMLKKNMVSTIDEAFDKYFGSYGERLCYVDSPYKYVSIQEAVSAIRAANGIPVLCHPFFYDLDEKELKNLIRLFKEAGGLAIETEYSLYTQKQRAALRALAAEFNLGISAGSDYHGNSHESLYNQFPANIYEDLMNLKDRYSK